MAKQVELSTQLFLTALTWRKDSVSKFAARNNTSQSHVSNVVAGRGSSQRLLDAAQAYCQKFVEDFCKEYGPKTSGRPK